MLVLRRRMELWNGRTERLLRWLGRCSNTEVCPVFSGQRLLHREPISSTTLLHPLFHIRLHIRPIFAGNPRCPTCACLVVIYTRMYQRRTGPSLMRSPASFFLWGITLCLLHIDCTIQSIVDWSTAMMSSLISPLF